IVPEIVSKFLFFFFQAEDGIRDFHVTGVQTCALPDLGGPPAAGGRSAGGRAASRRSRPRRPRRGSSRCCDPRSSSASPPGSPARSEERRVGKERRIRRTGEHESNKEDR